MKKNLLKTGIIRDLQVTIISFLLCFKQNQSPEKKKPTQKTLFTGCTIGVITFTTLKLCLNVVTTHHVGRMAITMHVLHCIYMR